MYHLALSLYQQYTSREEYSLLLLGLDNAGKTTLLSAIKSLYPVPFASKDAALPAITEHTVPTVGQTVATIELPDMYLKIWDVGGQHTLRRLWKSYYKSCHAIIFCIDSTDLGGDLAEGAEWQELARRGSAAHHTANPPDEEEGNGDTSGHVRRQPGKDENSESKHGRDGDDSRDNGLGRLDECRLVLESILESADTAGVPVLVLANKQDREDCIETVRIKEGLVRPIFESEKGSAVRDSRVLPISALKGTGVKESIEWIRSRVLWNREGRPPLLR